MTTCALFVDYENVVRSLRGQNINPTHKQLADLFRAEAARHGELVCARAYAPWDLYPEAMSIFDRLDIKPEYVEGGRKDNADLVMSLEIQEFLRMPGRDADTFILVTGDGDFVHVIRILQQEQKRVVVWGVEGSISNRLASRVGELASLQQLMAKHGALPSAGYTPDPGHPAVGQSEAPISRDLATRALILRSESVMLSRSWVQVPFLTLLHEMSISNLFGDEGEQRRLLIVKALEQGILETKKQPNPKRPGTETTFVLLRKESPTVAHTLKAVSRVVHHMRSLLERMSGANWIAYSLLDRSLSSDPVMPQGANAEAERRSWIDLCVAEGILRLERRENPKSPEHPTSALYLVEEHPLVQQQVPGEDLTPLLRRLILNLDHYLTRTGYEWMSMGLLRRQMSPHGQREMERAIRAANEAGLMLIRQQPNQFGVRPTTGAYLQVEHPLVAETFAMRDQILDELFKLFHDRDLIGADLIEERLAGLAHSTGLPPEEWIDLLTSHYLLSIIQTDGGETGYRFNRQHPVSSRRSSLVHSPGHAP